MSQERTPCFCELPPILNVAHPPPRRDKVDFQSGRGPGLSFSVGFRMNDNSPTNAEQGIRTRLSKLE